MFAVLPHPLANLGQFASSGVLITIAVAAGIWLAARAGLGTPIIDAALSGQPFAGRLRAIAGLAVGLGILAALAVVALDVAVFAPLLPRATPAPPLWTGALAALYGGLTEEILLRYCVMSLFAWLLTKIVRGPAAYWGAIAGAALLFGVGHLPATATVLPLSPLVVTRAIVLNGLAGVAFGWLYWRRGLEAAMVSHGSADLILHAAVRGIGA